VRTLTTFAPPLALSLALAPVRRPFASAAIVVVLGLALGGCARDSESEMLASAKGFVERKDLKAAVIQLKSVLQKNQQSGEARLLLGQVLLQGGDATGAALELAKARELQVDEDRVVPELARAMLLAGEAPKVLSQFGDTKLRGDKPAAALATTVAGAHMMQGNLEKATEAIKVALQAEPTNAAAITLQARLKASGGDTEGAMVLLDGVLGREAGNLDAGMFKGDLLRLVKADPAGALAAYQQVLTANTSSVAAHSAVMTLLMAQGRADDAKLQMAQMKSIAPNHPDTLFFAAQLAYSDKDFKTTRELADRILKMVPDSARVLELAGAAEYQRKAYGQAEALFIQAVKAAPTAPLPRQLLAQTLLRTGQPERCIEALQPLLDAPKTDVNTLTLAGEAYLQLGDAKRAEEAFKRASSAAPDDGRLRTALAVSQMVRSGDSKQSLQTLEALAASDGGQRANLALLSARLRQNDVPGALRVIDDLQSKQPDQPLAYLLRGRIQMLQKDSASARKNFEAALGKDANYFPAVASLAAMDVSEGKPDAAKQRLQALVQADPNSVQPRLALAELAARTGAPVAEVTLRLNEAVKANPNEARAHASLVMQLISSSDSKAALTAAQAGVAALPDNAETLNALAQAQLASGEAQQAMLTYRRLVNMQPTRVQHTLGLAEAQAANKDWDDANRSLRRALELQPNLLAAQRALVVVAVQRGRPQDGLPVAREMQKASPTESTGYVMEGDIEAAARNWDGAIAAYRGALQRAAPTEAAVKLHRSLLLAKRQPDADKFATDWQRDKPKDIAFRFYLGDAALSTKDYAGAEVHYRAVLQASPQHAVAMNNVAWLLVQQGKPGALDMANKANALAPDRAVILDTLASAQAAEGQLPAAVETQKRAVALAPKDANLRLALARFLLKSDKKALALAELEELSGLGDKFASQADVRDLMKQAR